MKPSFFKQLCWLILLLLFSNFANATTQSFKRIIVFGDSYSDNGNVYQLTHKQSPNSIRYYQGRYSDGPVWSEYLAEKFQLNPKNDQQFLNFAYGNAKVNETVIIKTPDLKQSYRIPSFSQQIDFFEQQQIRFRPTDLVTVFISANDVFDLAKTELTFKQLADEETVLIKHLIQLGAKHIIVLNGRDVSITPLAKIYAKSVTHSQDKNVLQKYVANFHHLIKIYNQQLANDLAQIPEVFLFDSFQFDATNIKQIKAGGLSYSTGNNNSYVIKEAFKTCYLNLQGNYFDVAGPVCSNPQDYYFYDRIHTTHYVNYLLAEQVYRKYLQNEDIKNRTARIT